MESNVVVIDNVSSWLRSVIDNAPAWKRKALKSVGWFMQQQIKAGIKSGSPGGQRYASWSTTDYMRDRLIYGPEGGRMTKARRRTLRHRARSNNAGRTGPLGKLSQVIRYAYNESPDSVETGWLTPWIADIGRKQEEGFTKTVSDGMRGYFLRSGLFIRPEKTKIVVPARPTFGPMYRALDPQIEPYMVKKLESYVEIGAPPTTLGSIPFAVFR